MTIEGFKSNVLILNHRLYVYAYRFLKTKEEAEDAVQEVFVKLWVIRDKLDTYKNLEAFAYRVTRNLCLDKIKAKKTISMPETSYYQPKQTYTPEKQLEDSEKFKLVQQIIDKLPDQQRLVIQFRDIDQYSFEEISELMEIELNAIRVNLSRARKKVRDEISKIYNYEISKN